MRWISLGNLRARDRKSKTIPMLPQAPKKESRRNVWAKVESKDYNTNQIFNYMKKGTIIILVMCFVFGVQNLWAQEKKQASIAFYNLENLFDTIDSPMPGDFPWTPGGDKIWNTERYTHKLNNLSYVIQHLDGNEDEAGPDILGVCEVENRDVLEDLIATESLQKSNYGIVHYDSPDHRGIDVGLLYRKANFEVLNSRSVTLTFPGEDYNTRDQLVVSGNLQGELIHVIVNHWPSRRGGPEKSEPRRIAAAKLTKSIIDSIRNTDPKAKIAVMGDLNDDPTNKSVTEILNATPKKEEVKGTKLYNPLAILLTDDRGTLNYRGDWFLFDQIMFSTPWLTDKNIELLDYNIFDQDAVKVQADNKYKGDPLRTHAGKLYLKGYSDHFSVFTIWGFDN